MFASVHKPTNEPTYFMCGSTHMWYSAAQSEQPALTLGSSLSLLLLPLCVISADEKALGNETPETEDENTALQSR